MTLSPPPSAVEASDLPGASGAARERALDALLDKVRSPEGRVEIEASLLARLGDAPSRRKAQETLRPGLPETQPLFRDLLAVLTLPDREEVASEITRLLKFAVKTDTSDELMRRAMGAVLSLVTDPERRPDPSSARADADRSPGRAGRSTPVTRTSGRSGSGPVRTAAAGAARQTDRYDPHGPFVLPVTVTRFGSEGELLAVTLLPAAPDERGAGPVRVPAALPAPPETADPELIRGWLRGIPAFTDSLGVRAGLLDHGDAGDLMEIEAEFHSDPKGALRLYKAADPVADGTADAAWCARLGRDLGRFGVTHERGVEALASGLREQILRAPGERSAALRRYGAVLTVREGLAEAVCGLLDAEADYLEDGPRETSGPDQNLLGAFSPVCDLSRGRCLERALTLHIIAGVPMGGAMRQSLTEFRLAQAVRANPDASVESLDRRFDLDPALPLSELCGRDPIFRIGMSEPVLVPG